jgi:hypothetical protein
MKTLLLSRNRIPLWAMIAALAWCNLIATSAWAQNKPIRLIVPYAAGGPIDVTALASAPSAALAEPATLAVRAENERITQLESASVALRSELAELRQQFAEFRKQFE